MPYKIVQTIEKGKEQFSICPSNWESDDILRWPKKNAEKLSKLEYSSPRADWTKINCILERKDIQNYDDAKEELNVILSNETYEEDDKSKIIKDLLEHGNASSQQDNCSSVAIDTLTSLKKKHNNIHTCDIEVNSNSCADEAEELTKYEKILYNQKILFDNQNIIIENQKKIMVSLRKFSNKLDKIITSDEMPDRDLSVIDEVNVQTRRKFTQKPIENVEELKNLEDELSNEVNKENYKKKYSIFCSRGKGLNCAYQLVDIFFTREFLTQCSWSGCTRGSGMKVSLKSFQKFLSFFFELIHDCDHTYTIQENNMFFKSILKNATKRTHAKFQRISTSRNRRKLADNAKNINCIKKSIEPNTNDNIEMDTETATKHNEVVDDVKSDDTNTCNNDNASKTVKISTSDNKDAKNATLTFNVILKVD